MTLLTLLECAKVLDLGHAINAQRDNVLERIDPLDAFELTDANREILREQNPTALRAIGKALATLRDELGHELTVQLLSELSAYCELLDAFDAEIARPNQGRTI